MSSFIHQISPFADENQAPEWNSATQNTCLEWIRLALEKEEISEKELIAEMVERHDTLALLADNETIIAQLRQRLVNKGNQFKSKELIIKANKLENLKKETLTPPKPTCRIFQI